MLELVESPRSRTIRIADGRIAGYYDFGDPNGTPVVAFHGTPACGAGFAWADERARARGIRLLAPDRPGVGDSTPWPVGEGRTVAEYAPVIEAFADALDLPTFAVLGYSGGGPYALAAAHALQSRITRAAIVSGAGQVGVWASVRDFETTDWLLTQLSGRIPIVARAILHAGARAAVLAPRTSLRFARFEMSRADLAVMDEFPSPRAALSVFSQSCSHGAQGVVDDYAALGRRWDFAVDEITVPVHCWHATTDEIVPLAHSEELVRRVPDARLSQWDGEGHLAIVDHVGEVFDDLIC